jgi:hypothetical protein
MVAIGKFVIALSFIKNYQNLVQMPGIGLAMVFTFGRTTRKELSSLLKNMLIRIEKTEEQ